MKPQVKNIPTPVTLKIGDLIASRNCVSASNGEKIYNKLAPLIESSIPVCLSFEGVRIVNTAFLNVAVGQLFGHFAKDRIENLISYNGLSGPDMKFVERVMKNSEIYFSRKSAYDRAWKEEIGDYGGG